MKYHHWIIALCVGVLLGIFVFKMTRPPKPPQLHQPPIEETTNPGSKTSDPPPNPAEASSASDFVRIPGGSFQSGANNATVDVRTFWIDRTEVTNSQYEAFLNECPPGSECGPRDLPDYWEDQGYLENRRDHPVVHISWDDASAFCRWEEGRLPSIQEWEKAARGNDERIFPAGNKIDPTVVNILGEDRRDEKRRAPRQIATWGVHPYYAAIRQASAGALSVLQQHPHPGPRRGVTCRALA